MMRSQRENQQTTRRRQAVGHARRGATLVEFAFVAPVLFSLIFACIELTRVYMIQSLAEDAAYEAARLCMVSGSTKEEGVAEANRILSMLGTQDADVELSAVSEGEEQDEISDDTDQITVNISIPMASNTLFLSFFTGGVTLDAQVTLLSERYKGYYESF